MYVYFKYVLFDEDPNILHMFILFKSIYYYLPYFCSFPNHLIFLSLYKDRNITPAISNPITRPKTMPPAKTPPSENMYMYNNSVSYFY